MVNASGRPAATASLRQLRRPQETEHEREGIGASQAAIPQRTARPGSGNKNDQWGTGRSREYSDAHADTGKGGNCRGVLGCRRAGRRSTTGVCRTTAVQFESGDLHLLLD